MISFLGISKTSDKKTVDFGHGKRVGIWMGHMVRCGPHRVGDGEEGGRLGEVEEYYCTHGSRHWKLLTIHLHRGNCQMLWRVPSYTQVW